MINIDTAITIAREVVAIDINNTTKIMETVQRYGGIIHELESMFINSRVDGTEYGRKIAVLDDLVGLYNHLTFKYSLKAEGYRQGVIMKANYLHDSVNHLATANFV
jgi:hypothetical protein